MEVPAARFRDVADETVLVVVAGLELVVVIVDMPKSGDENAGVVEVTDAADAALKIGMDARNVFLLYYVKPKKPVVVIVEISVAFGPSVATGCVARTGGTVSQLVLIVCWPLPTPVVVLLLVETPVVVADTVVVVCAGCCFNCGCSGIAYISSKSRTCFR